MNKEQTTWEGRFDEIFPLAMFATRDYQGDASDGELNFVRWQNTETANAKFKINLFKEFIASELSKALQQKIREIRKEILHEVPKWKEMSLIEDILENPINAICEFEWTGGSFSLKGHPYDGARDYQLVHISK